MAKYILFDTETTGIADDDRVIQVGAMIVDSKGSVEVHDELCSSDQAIKLEAMEVHGITPELLIGKSKFTDTNFYKALLSLNTPDNFLIAHNMPFDMGMIKKEGFESNLQIIDTLRCARHLLKDSPYHRLQYFRYSLELYKIEAAEAKKHNIVIKAHDAIGDVLVMKLLLSKLVERVKAEYAGVNPMLKLVELSNTPIFIETFKFGKHKDKKIVDVCDQDIGYINWMQKNMDLDEDMKYTLDKIMGA
ncbi:MAG: 3'-5' exonuclease [Helicobacteraceae bacterium]|nr:3'-5' exonuclease [Helicobacteraceae bacterium]